MTISQVPRNNISDNTNFQDGNLLNVQCKQQLPEGISGLLSAIGNGVDREGTQKRRRVSQICMTTYYQDIRSILTHF
ncbi:MAG: hypothetical protein CM1200mP39_07310 [Dehalococcoidia bacterium]|nr:MAG: hypothetical protein CM1200mP39_07310 [Dehalococcoidia bacterium]